MEKSIKEVLQEIREKVAANAFPSIKIEKLGAEYRPYPVQNPYEGAVQSWWMDEDKQ